jgi:hypothetical protein
MTDRHAELDTALERVIAAARDHLAAVKAADGRADDDEVWRAYVELNNASNEYDELLLDAFGEVTPWDVEAIDPEEADRQFGVGLGGVDGTEPEDPHPHVISVRQRRDYRVSSVSALFRVAEAARRANPASEEEPPAVETVGEAVLELMQAGDGSLAALDIPELESLDGVVVVAEVEAPLDPESYEDHDGAGPFTLAEGDRVVDRLDEHALFDLEDSLDEESEEELEDAEEGEVAEVELADGSTTGDGARRTG